MRAQPVVPRAIPPAVQVEAVASSQQPSGRSRGGREGRPGRKLRADVGRAHHRWSIVLEFDTQRCARCGVGSTKTSEGRMYQVWEDGPDADGWTFTRPPCRAKEGA